MPNVLIIGASHGIGLETVGTALRAGLSVRALARSAASMPIQDANLDRVSGNALDPDTIRNVLRDIDVVIQTLGVDFSPRLVFEGTRLFSESTRILVDAMKAAGVKRLITVTGLGAGVQRPRHSVIPLKADIHQRGLHVRLVPSADMGHSLPVCLPSSPVRQRVMRHQTLKPSAAQDNGHFSISHPAQPRPLTAYRHLIKFAEQATKPQGFSNSAPC